VFTNLVLHHYTESLTFLFNFFHTQVSYFEAKCYTFFFIASLLLIGITSRKFKVAEIAFVLLFAVYFT
jgi:hypothetical protein